MTFVCYFFWITIVSILSYWIHEVVYGFRESCLKEIGHKYIVSAHKNSPWSYTVFIAVLEPK